MRCFLMKLPVERTTKAWTVFISVSLEAYAGISLITIWESKSFFFNTENMIYLLLAFSSVKIPHKIIQLHKKQRNILSVN